MEKIILVAGQPNRGDSPESETFKIKDWKLYVPAVTLSAENDNKLLEQLKTGFKTFTNVNRLLFVLTFENEDDRTFFFKILSTKS